MAEKLVIRKRGDDGYKTFSVRSESDTIEKIDELAKQTNISRNNLIQEMLDFAIDKIEIQK